MGEVEREKSGPRRSRVGRFEGELGGLATGGNQAAAVDEGGGGKVEPSVLDRFLDGGCQSARG